MSYTELKEYMTDFHLGKITKLEMAFAIGLWQIGDDARKRGAE